MVAAGAAVNDHDGCSAATILKDLLKPLALLKLGR